MANEIKRLSITFIMSNPSHRRAWELIEKVPKGGRTEFICERIAEKAQAKELSQTVYTAVKRALAECDFKPQKEQYERTDEAGEIENNILGFITSLSKEGG